jgi:hypothetical protein
MEPEVENVSRTYESLRMSGGRGEPSRMTAVFPVQLLDVEQNTSDKRFTPSARFRNKGAHVSNTECR